LSLSSEVEQQTQELANVDTQINISGVVDVMAREHAFTMELHGRYSRDRIIT
jgi:hypothetical protein